MKKRCWLLVMLIAITLLLSSCAVAPPRDRLNVCKIFRQYPKWYWAARHTRAKWGVPVSVQMAIIYQESRYGAHARPPREKLLGFVPWFRPTSAKGYTQAVNGTWRLFVRDTGRRDASRANFVDATDFIGWFINRAHHQLGIAKNNAFADYLAYHEGILGYARGTYRHKGWLIAVARHVQRNANRYRWQLLRCEKRLPKKTWWHFW